MLAEGAQRLESAATATEDRTSSLLYPVSIHVESSLQRSRWRSRSLLTPFDDAVMVSQETEKFCNTDVQHFSDAAAGASRRAYGIKGATW